MKKLTVKKGSECMACLQCVQACSEAFFKEFDPDLSCIQCGKCMKVCEAEAITQNPKTGVYMINKKKCVGCGKCVEACPMKVMVMHNDIASKCISCGICAKACPMEVLEVVES